MRNLRPDIVKGTRLIVKERERTRESSETFILLRRHNPCKRSEIEKEMRVNKINGLFSFFLSKNIKIHTFCIVLKLYFNFMFIYMKMNIIHNDYTYVVLLFFVIFNFICK